MKESKEERAKQVLERKKELEKQKIQAVQQKLEKRPAETNQEGQKKKPAVEVQIKSTANTFAKPVGKPVHFFNIETASSIKTTTKKAFRIIRLYAKQYPSSTNPKTQTSYISTNQYCRCKWRNNGYRRFFVRL